MRAIWDFLKSLVLPSKMQRYRNITVLIPICIMLLVASVLSFPPVKVFENTKYENIEEKNYLNLQNILMLPSDNADVTTLTNELLALNLKATVKENGTSYYINVEGMNYNDPVKEWNVVYPGADGRTAHLKVIFDYCDPSTEENIANHQNANLDPYKAEDTVYKSDSENIYYVIAIYTSFITYGYSNYANESATFTSVNFFYNQEFILDLTNVEKTPEGLGLYLSHFIIDGYEATYDFMIQIQIYIMVPLFTLIFALLFWLCFKRNGKLKRFKEYFNIAGICMVVPAIIFFAVEWIYPAIADYYMYGMALFYVFVLFKINSSPDLV